MTFNYKKSDIFMIGLGVGILLSQAALALAEAHDRKAVRKQADKILHSPDQHHDLKDPNVNYDEPAYLRNGSPFDDKGSLK